ncbi:maleylacetate reductase [Oceanisphaera sp.]|uniref:maleylacetate reductase n=1 Tax=Oceanisphaera sp. TaxID=1929979 RepID=UPI003A925691
MQFDFTYSTQPTRTLFGAGKIQRVGPELRALGKHRALIICTPSYQAMADTLKETLGDLGAGVFAQATVHTPIEVTEGALTVLANSKADGIIALGGGSAIGLSKALAYRTGLLQLILPTTYSGSEATQILGQTEHGIKTTVQDPAILPEVVIYDPELTLDLPVDLSITSAMNAMAHALEAMYAQNAHPLTALMATEAIRQLREALPILHHTPQDLAARSQALYGAWLAGTLLGNLGMSLHHKLCHVLGGLFNLPHAATHTILLPHTIGYNQQYASTQLRPACTLFGEHLGTGLYDYAASLKAPLALKVFGLTQSDLEHAATQAVAKPYWNPGPINRDVILQILQNAWEGVRPAGHE